jgi:hypothetical protein
VADPPFPMVLIGPHRICACSPKLTSSCCRSTSQKNTPSAYRDGRQRAPLWLPTPCRSRPIATTALPFVVRVSPEGAVSVRLTV